MKLSAIIMDYRNRMQISQREFARRCDLSNSYISFLEKEANPKTGKPMVPTIEQYKKLADGMNITLQKLFEMLDDDSPVNLSVPILPEPDTPLTPEARIISGGIDRMPKERREQALKILQVAFSEYADYFKEERHDDT